MLSILSLCAEEDFFDLFTSVDLLYIHTQRLSSLFRPSLEITMTYSEPPKDGREAAERLRATVKSGKPIIGSGAGIGL